MYKLFFKRLIDFSFAFFGLILLSPLFILIVILLFFLNQGTPFFFQKRPGKNERIFKVIKFKTMNDRKGTDGKLLSDAHRLTKLGLFIRKTSLDEIPQLFNVLRGEMSLIGPRPLLPEYLALYNAEQKKRHDVKSGITGWAQINGRNAISWEQKFEYDVWYVNNVSLIIDLKIFFRTFSKVFKNEGISANGHITMPTFTEFIKNKKND